MESLVLKITDLEAGYVTKGGDFKAVDRVSFNLKKGEFLGIAGESGCGKSTLAYAILNLLEDNGKIFSGSIHFKEKDLVQLSEKELTQIRWRDISMVFQSAMNALNPVLTIEDQLVDVILAHHKKLAPKKAVERAAEMLELVDITADRLKAYPHQLSGGMKQRVMIAMALMLEPEIIIMDEPTTALDVVVQRTIIEKIADLRNIFNFSVIFITHDLSLLVEISDTLAIMYSGEIIEYGPADQVYSAPIHPYTKGLMDSFPPLTGELIEFGGIAGKPPDFLKLPSGCRFHPRCSKKMPICVSTVPDFEEIKTDHSASCFLSKPGSNQPTTDLK
ncbi:MAG: ABC transporter ATP-binding protein [Deltaproteobacteria bacterium]|jgi:peptide/nickel transport system ATP-binding protein|nr:ABC transporter ATP-binding protein [Deltaproteobacteria bacterium]